MGDRDIGSARRRRDRRQRSRWRREQQSVRAAAAAALHHSRDEGLETHDAKSGQKAAAARDGMSQRELRKRTLQLAAEFVKAGVFPSVFQGAPAPQIQKQIVVGNT